MSSIPETPQAADTPSRRRRFKRAPLARELPLTPRDVAILETIQSYGGVLTTAEISWLFWPLDIAARLRYWKLGNEDIQRLLEQQPAGYLNEKVELLQFLNKLRRLRAGPKRLTAEYRRLQAWLQEVTESQPETRNEIEALLAELEKVPPAEWLPRAIAQNVRLPDSLPSLPVKPSDLVSSACIKRLRLLYDAGWLDKDEPLVKLQHGRGQTLWFLSKKARDQLARVRGVPVKKMPWRQAGTYGHLHIPHRLAINDFRIAVTLAAGRQGFVIRKWLDEADLRRTMGKQTLTLLSDPEDPDSKTIERKLVPDSFFWLETDKNWFHFLEIDRATETLQYSDPSRDLQFWALKVRKYGQHFKHFYSQTYPEAEGRGRILVVTTSETRLANMAGVCREVAKQAAGRYWLTTFDKIKPDPTDYFSETVLTGEIWQRADRPEKLRTLVW